MIIKTAPLGSLGANFYCIIDEASKEMIAIDPGDRPDLVADILNSQDAALKYIIITHAHADHISALDKVKNTFDVPVVIHSLDAEALQNGNLNLCPALGFDIPETKADICVNDNDILAFGTKKARFVHTPGHTPGSMCILIDDALFSGDTLFQLSIGRTDFPGGSFEQISSSIIKKIYTLSRETKVYPGHGDSTTIGYEADNNPFVKGI